VPLAAVRPLEDIAATKNLAADDNGDIIRVSSNTWAVNTPASPATGHRNTVHNISASAVTFDPPAGQYVQDATGTMGTTGAAYSIPAHGARTWTYSGGYWYLENIGIHDITEHTGLTAYTALTAGPTSDATSHHVNYPVMFAVTLADFTFTSNSTRQSLIQTVAASSYSATWFSETLGSSGAIVHKITGGYVLSFAARFAPGVAQRFEFRVRKVAGGSTTTTLYTGFVDVAANGVQQGCMINVPYTIGNADDYVYIQVQQVTTADTGVVGAACISIQKSVYCKLN